MTSLTMKRRELLATELKILREQHRDLDIAIAAIEEGRPNDFLTIKRLKKQKLVLKDRIARIEDELTPDIIA